LPRDLGATRRSPADTVLQALQDITALGLTLVAKSALYASPCFPAGAGPDYINSVAAFTEDDEHTPDQILNLLHRVEAAHGRQRSTRWAGRVLDLDLLAMGDQVLPDAQTFHFWRDLAPDQQAQRTPDQLILPHPRLADRAFVLVPLAEIAPDWRHPVLGLTATALRDALPATDLAAICPLDT
jgi:2-amino-4-hydroxy-6-hydroxymethyldihydropteridine diphosphokinase